MQCGKFFKRQRRLYLLRYKFCQRLQPFFAGYLRAGALFGAVGQV